MATYHQLHPFQGGALSAVWNPKTRKREQRTQPKWCVVCGRKQDHILHIPAKVTP